MFCNNTLPQVINFDVPAVINAVVAQPGHDAWQIFVDNIPNVFAACLVIITVFYNCYVLKKTIGATSKIESNKVSVDLKKEWLANIINALCNYHSVGKDFELYLSKLQKVEVAADEFLELYSSWSQAAIRLTVLLNDDNKVHIEFKEEMERIDMAITGLLSARIKGKSPSESENIFGKTVRDKVTEVVQDANAELVRYVNEMAMAK